MKYKIICLALLCFSLSINVFTQKKPDWIVSFENTIKQKEKLWKIESQIDNSGEEGAYNFSFTLRSGKNQSSVRIGRFPVPNLEETFGGLVIAFDNTMGKKAKKVKLENFGDEGVLWNINKEEWTTVMFRKGEIFIDIFAPSEKTARRFAAYIIEQMP